MNKRKNRFTAMADLFFLHDIKSISNQKITFIEITSTYHYNVYIQTFIQSICGEAVVLCMKFKRKRQQKGERLHGIGI